MKGLTIPILFGKSSNIYYINIIVLDMAFKRINVRPFWRIKHYKFVESGFGLESLFISFTFTKSSRKGFPIVPHRVPLTIVVSVGC